MTTIETPAATIARAAARLRELAERATHEGRIVWTTGHTLGSRSPVVLDHPDEPSVLIETYAARLEAVNRYVAAVGPATGLAVAAWLDQAAEALIGVDVPDDEPALAVARQILGGA